jgi:hypothetical protein
MPGWSFDKRPLNDACKLNMPRDWHLEVYKVKSPDSDPRADPWWCQLMWEVDPDTKELSSKHNIVLCDCPVGKWNAPLIVLGLEDFICKHGQALLAYLRSKK